MQRCGNRSSLLVPKLMHRRFSEAHPIGLPRVMRRHGATMPAEDRLKLGDSGPVLGRAGYAAAMRSGWGERIRAMVLRP